MYHQRHNVLTEIYIQTSSRILSGTFSSPEILQFLIKTSHKQILKVYVIKTKKRQLTQICLHVPKSRSKMGVKVVVEQRLDLHVDVRLEFKREKKSRMKMMDLSFMLPEE